MNNSIKISELIIPDKYKIQYKILYGDYFYIHNSYEIDYVVKSIQSLMKDGQANVLTGDNVWEDLSNLIDCFNVKVTVYYSHFYDSVAIKIIE